MDLAQQSVVKYKYTIHCTFLKKAIFSLMMVLFNRHHDSDYSKGQVS